jgi:hypothetical protein
MMMVAQQWPAASHLFASASAASATHSSIDWPGAPHHVYHSNSLFGQTLIIFFGAAVKYIPLLLDDTFPNHRSLLSSAAAHRIKSNGNPIAWPIDT